MTVHHHRIRIGLLGLVLLFCLERSAASQTLNVEAAKKEGKLVAYGTIVPKVMEPVHRGFEQKYGIKVEYWRANATQVVERALSEWQAGRPGFDLTFAIHGAQLLLKTNGVFAKYTPPSAEIFPANFKDKDGMLTAWRHTPVGVLFNTELVKPGEPVQVTLTLYPTSNLFMPGHRIRLDGSSSNFPRFDVNPNTGEAIGRERRRVVADNTVFHERGRESRVVVPNIPR